MIGALIGAGAGILQTLIGSGQGRKAKKMERANIRPEMLIPEEVTNVTSRAKMRANQGLSSQAYGNALNKIWRNRNSSLAALQDRRSGLAGISNINQVQNDASLKLDIMDDAQRQQNRRYADGQELNLANWKQRAWDWNQKGKYLETADAIRALRGSSQRNINGGINNILTAGLMGFQQKGGGANDPVYLGEQYGYAGGLPPRTPNRRRQDWTNYPED